MTDLQPLRMLTDEQFNSLTVDQRIRYLCNFITRRVDALLAAAGGDKPQQNSAPA